MCSCLRCLRCLWAVLRFLLLLMHLLVRIACTGGAAALLAGGGVGAGFPMPSCSNAAGGAAAAP